MAHCNPDRDDFLRLLLRSEREVIRYVMAIVPNAADAQEIFQETAVALWKQIDKYDPSEPFTPWACRFAANKAKEHLRKQGRWYGFLDENIANALLERRAEISPLLDRRAKPLRDCVKSLPTHQRALIEKHYFDQRSIDELSIELKRTAAALYKSLQRIRVTLTDCVTNKLAASEATG